MEQKKNKLKKWVNLKCPFCVVEGERNEKFHIQMSFGD